MSSTGLWRALAACRGAGPEFWYPELSTGVGGHGHPYADAKPVCDACPVRLECLEHALAVNERFGMWGGLSPTERARVRKERREVS